jgi:hypothetical protein
MIMNKYACVLLLGAAASVASARASAQEACEVERFETPAGSLPINGPELDVICNEGATRYEAAVAKCGAPHEAACVAARRRGCHGWTSTDLDTVAKCYRATESSQPLPRQAQPLGAEAGPGAVGIIAQGAGDFLMSRAEQEVSLYAATELNKAVCKKYGASYFPKTCALLKEGEDETAPVGLGVLRRSVIEDVQALPKNVLSKVFSRLNDKQKLQACGLDVGYAFAIGLLDQRAVEPLFLPDPKSVGHLLLYRYATLEAEAPCDAFWKTVEQSAGRATNGAWVDLNSALAALSTKADPKESRRRVVLASIAVLKQLSAHQSDVALDEAGAIAVAIADQDWIGLVAATAAAQTLGPILLCKQGEGACELDSKARATLRLVGDVAAADSSEGVSSALARFAAPLGSWRRKYEGASLMLQGYVGAKYGVEWVEGDVRSGQVLSPALAIGLEVGGPLWSHGRLGFFFQAVDIGNVSSVRLSSEDDDNLARVEVAPDVTAAQLLAPGIFATFAPWKAPFAFSVGVDWVPALRTVVGADQRAAWHLTGGIVVDTPILELVHD